MKKFLCFVGILGVLVLGWANLGFCGLGIVTVTGTTTVFTTIQAGVNACPEGGTVTASSATYPEAVYINKRIAVVGVGTPTIDSSGIANTNTVTFDGIDTVGASISGFIITGATGTTQNLNGHGIYCKGSSSPTIKNNVVTKNKFCGISNWNSYPIITNNILIENGDLGIWSDSSVVMIADNLITKNSFGADCQWCSGTLTGNKITDSINGLGMYGCFPSMVVTNNIIAGHSASGVVCDVSDSSVLTNNTISNNGEGGIFCNNSSSSTITNNIITENGTTNNDFSGIGAFNGANPSINYNCVWGNGSTGDRNYSGCFGGIGSITANPQFIGGGDYHLQASSPVIDKGTNTAPAIPATDKDSKPRIINSTVDMGAYEYGTPTPSPAPGSGTITKIGTPTIAYLGGTVTFTLTYQNTGSVPANFMVFDFLPDELLFATSTPAYCGAATATGITIYFWNLGMIIPGEGGTITLITKVDTSTECYLENKAELWEGTQSLSISTSTTHIVSPPPSLASGTITKIGTPTIAYLGGTVTWTLTYQNTGSTSSTFVVKDYLPIGLTYATSTPAYSYATGTNTYVWDVGTVTPSQTGTITLITKVATSTEYYLENKAELWEGILWLLSTGTFTVHAILVPEPPGTITGTISDAETLYSISGAVVEIMVAGSYTAIGSATTNASGNYTIGGLADGSYTVRAKSTGYQTKFYFAGTSSIVVINQGQTISNININLLPIGAKGGKIAFQSADDGDNEIYIMNADSPTFWRRLTNNSADDTTPAFSLDGTKIAFCSNRNGNQQIYIMNTDGTNQIQLTNNLAVGAYGSAYPAFSPDGTKIAFCSQHEGTQEIYLMNVDGSNQTRLTTVGGDDVVPSFSPDGLKITFQSTRDGNWNIYIMNVDGSNQTGLTTDGNIDSGPNFSPNGTKIAFTSNRNVNEEEYIMNADGSSQTRLTNNSSRDGRPYFSPDASKIAFDSTRDGNDGIYTMNADGSSQTRVTDMSSTAGKPAWCPGCLGDGTIIKIGTPIPSYVGGTVTWILTYQNIGSTNVTFVVKDYLPAGLTFATSTPAYSYATGTNTYVWEVGTVTPSQTGTITLFTKVATSTECDLENKTELWEGTLWLLSTGTFTTHIAFGSVSVYNASGTLISTHPKIQEGVNACPVGGTVLVSDGTYTGTGNKNLIWTGKKITVKSINGAGSTIIDCENSGRGFYFNNAEDCGTISGFTIRRGYVDYGGGINCYNNSTITITNCIISGNTATVSGGGICVWLNSSAIVTNCTISQNIANMSHHGGGICCDANSFLSITNSTIFKNTAGEGGGICWYYSSGTATNCVIATNTASYGGGIRCLNSSPSITNNIISGNSGDSIYCSYSSPTITNNTILGNSGHGIRSLDNSSPTIYNNIITENGTTSTGYYGIYKSSGNPIINYNCVWGNGSPTTNNYSGNFAGANDISANPQFIGESDYHLGTTSPCINKGSNTAPGIPSTDKDGNPRIYNNYIVDMGAYEYQGTVTPPTWPVNVYDASGNFVCGTDTIQKGVNACPVGGTVSVSAGTYTEAVNINKRIAVIGVGTPTIDPPTDGSAVTFNGDSADNASISGFRITGATGGSGYGISCVSGAEPQIINNIITGNSSYGIYSDTNSAPAIKDNTISNNGSYAIWLYANGLRNGVDNNTLSGNGYNNAISVWYGAVSNNATWHNFGTETVYRMRGDGSECAVQVNSGVTLNIEPGCILKFENKTGILCYGTLTAIGNDPIVFTSINDDTYGGDTNADGTATQPAGGDWRGLSFKSAYQTGSAKNSVIDNCIVKYGGNRVTYDNFCHNGNITVADEANITIQNSTITNSKYDGIYCTRHYGPAPSPSIGTCTISNNGGGGIVVEDVDSAPTIVNNTIQNNVAYGLWFYPNALRNVAKNNTFTGNGYNNAISVWYGAVSNNAVWHNFGTETVYRMRGDGNERAVQVNSGVNLNIEPGCILKFENKTGLLAYGTLTAIGNDTIVFTSINDDTYGGDTNVNGTATTPAGGDWRGLSFKSAYQTGSAKNSVIDNCIVKYAGSGVFYDNFLHNGNITVADEANITIQNSTITNSKYDGIYCTRHYGPAPSPSIGTCTISNNGGGGIVVEDVDSAPTIVNNTIQNNVAYGLWLHPNALRNVAKNNTLTNNGYNNAISVWYGAVSNNSTWHNFGTETVYRIRNDGGYERAVEVNTGVTLNIEPGCIFKFEGKTGLIICGTLTAIGNDPIVFTSINDDTYGGDTNGTITQPAGGDWRSVCFENAGASSSVLDYCILRYGGNGGSYDYFNHYGNITGYNSSPSIKNSTISNSGYDGVYCSSSFSPSIGSSTIGTNSRSGVYCNNTASKPTIANSTIINNISNGLRIPANGVGNLLGNNTFFGNDYNNAIDVFADSVTTNGTWSAYIYRISGNVGLNSGVTVNIQPGAILKFDTGNIGIGGEGVLKAEGTQGANIIFTSIKDDTYGGDTNGTTTPPGNGDWRSVYFRNTGASSSVLDYCILRYGGNGGSYDYFNHYGNITGYNSSPSIKNSTVSNSGYDGVYCFSSFSPSIGSSTIGTNSRSGVYCNDTASKPTIIWNTITANQYGIYSKSNGWTLTPNDIYGNTAYGVYNNSGGTLTAKNNWWGAVNGPSGTGTGSGDKVNAKVVYNPWLYSPIAYGSILGDVKYWGTQIGTLYAQAFTNPNFTGTPTAQGTASSPYVLTYLPPATYYVRAFLDTNSNQTFDVGEPKDCYQEGTPLGVAVPQATNISNINIDIGIYLSKIYHNATKPLKAGDVLQVTLVGSSLGTATFDIGTLTAGVPMTEIQPGTYTGTYTVLAGNNIANATITGRLVKGDFSANKDADVPVTIDTTSPVFNIDVLGTAGVGTMAIKVSANEPLAGTPSLSIKDSADATIVSTCIGFADGTYTYQATITTTTPDGTATISVVGTDTAGNQGTGSKTFQVSIPRKVVRVDGEGQNGTVTTTLKPFVVQVTDNLDRPIPNHPVHWQIIESQSPANLLVTATTTGANGTTSSVLTLGTKSGSYKVTAQGSMQATFTATALPDTATILEIVTGDGQTGTVATGLAPFVVKVMDIHGNSIAGHPVNWNIIESQSSANLSTNTTTTGANGTTSTTLTLGTKSGSYKVTAQGSMQATFTATALPDTATILEIVTGDGQTGTVATGLAPFVVKVTDTHGNSIVGHQVNWQIIEFQSQAFLSTSTTTTGANGTTSTSLTLGTKSGSYKVTAQGSMQATFTATALPDVATILEIVTGNNQNGTVATGLTPFVVKVTDTHGNSITGHTVNWQIIESQSPANLLATATTTGANGTTSSVLTLGTKSGSYKVTAAGSMQATFTATANPDVATILEGVSGDGQTGTVITGLAPFVVKVTDTHGNSIVGHQVNWQIIEFQSQAFLSTSTTTTGANGTTSTSLTLGTKSGSYKVTAKGSMQATFTATALPDVATILESVSGNGQTGTVATGLAPFVVKVTDTHGNSIVGHQVNWQIIESQSPANLLATATTTGANGTTSTSLTLGTKSGSYKVTAQGSMQATFTATAVPNTATVLESVSGDSQTGTVATGLAPFVVKVTDTHGNSIVGHQVNWQIIESQSPTNLLATATTTGANGTTSTSLTLGTKSGTYKVTAAGSMQATFTATANPDVLAQINISPESPEIVIKRQLTFTAAGYDQYNNNLGALIYNWNTLGGIGSLTATTGTSTTLIATSSAAVGTITANNQGITGSNKVTIIYGQLTSVTVTPITGATVKVDGTQSFTAQGFNQYGDAIAGVTYRWTVIPANIGTVNPSMAQTTVFTGLEVGTGNVQVEAVFGTQTKTVIATVTVLSKGVEKLSLTVGTLTAWMPGTITIQLQDNLGNPTPATSATTIIVTGDGDSRFATASVGVNYNVVGTFTVQAGTSCTSFFFKQNGTTTSVIITATILGTNISSTISVTIVQPVTGSSSGTVVGDDGRTTVVVVVGSIVGQGVIEIDTNPGTTTQTDQANQADNADATINRVEGTMREFEIDNATITATGVWIVIPYPDADNDGYVDGMLPQTHENTLAIYKLVGTQWVEVPGSVVDGQNNTVSAPVPSFSYYIVMGKVQGAEDTLSNVFAYPNPCRVYKGARQITFGKLTGQANIKIFNIVGELVKEIEHTNGTDEEVWTNPNEVASGVYIYLITNNEGQKVIGKLGIIK